MFDPRDPGNFSTVRPLLDEISLKNRRNYSHKSLSKRMDTVQVHIQNKIIKKKPQFYLFNLNLRLICHT